MCVCVRCDVVCRFNEGLYDIIIAADERSLDDPQAVSDASADKRKLVHTSSSSCVVMICDSCCVSLMMLLTECNAHLSD